MGTQSLQRVLIPAITALKQVNSAAANKVVWERDLEVGFKLEQASSTDSWKAGSTTCCALSTPIGGGFCEVFYTQHDLYFNLIASISKYSRPILWPK